MSLQRKNTCIFISALCFFSLGFGEAKRRSIWTETETAEHLGGHGELVHSRISSLGEKETRIAFKGVKLIETTEPSQGEDFLFIKEAVKKNRFVWLVYQDKTHIIDCNITTDRHAVHKFLRKFNNFNSNDHKTAALLPKPQKEPKDQDLLSFRNLLRECRSFKKQVRAMRIESHRLEHEAHKKDKGHRAKRNAFSMIYPGTNWCGAGDKASGGYEDLGENLATDRCCREHDHCPYFIGRFSTEYNYWNYRFHTLLHCNCEERFQACLKSAGNSIASMIGYIYFNYVGTTCFNLKPVKTCQKRSWWGACSSYSTEYTAQVRESSLNF